MCQQIESFILGSFRLLLFLGSSIMALIGILLAMEISWARSFYSDLGATDWHRNLTWLFVCAIYLVSLCLAGSLGAFFNNKKVIQLFGILLVLNILVCILALVFLPDLEDSENKFKARLLQAQAQYDWTDTSNYSAGIDDDTPMTKAEATHLWDKLQHENYCCGLHSYEEWEPLAHNGATYPKSCCVRPMVQASSNSLTCDKDSVVRDTNKKGCLGALYAPLMIILITFWAAMLFSVPMSIVACVSSIKGPHRHEAQSMVY